MVGFIFSLSFYSFHLFLYKNKDENKKGYQISGARKGRKQKTAKERKKV